MSSALTIPHGRPEAISQDFDRLRAEGISHLEKLATEIWTDFNAGNPGITMLEVLCYAITDLGYRTRETPIADLSVGDGVRKMFFLPEEILTSAPVTANDFRKLLIDLPGVKNAWIEDVVIPYDATKTDQLSLYYGVKDAEKQLIFPERLLKKAVLLNDEQSKATFIRGLLTGYTGKIPLNGLAVLVDYIKNTATTIDANNEALIAIKDYLRCVYGIVPIKYTNDRANLPGGEVSWAPFNPLVPHGLYRVIIDLDDDIKANEEFKKMTVRGAALAALHANRGLCHDYLDVEILDTEEIAVCLDLQLADGADEKMVLAEALYNLQDFLTPTVRFYSLAEMLEKKKSNNEQYRMDDIYNGPLLLNGFIDDVELDRHKLKPNAELNFSELIHSIVVNKKNPIIKGLLAVNNIAVRQTNKSEWFDWEKVNKLHAGYTGTPPNPYKPGSWRTDNPALAGKNNFKYRIKPEISEFRIKKGNGNTYSIKFSLFQEEYERIQMERNCKYCMPQSTQSPSVKGRFRRDLAKYRSIQYDFPGVYRVGDQQWHDDAPAEKIGPTRQLQTYLLFFDQILAAYLTRLGETAQMLAVEQDVLKPGYVLPALFEVPGVQEILEARARILLTEEDSAKLAPTLLTLLSQDDNTEHSQYQDTLAVLRGFAATGKPTTIPKIRKAIAEKNGGIFIKAIEAYCWKKYTDDPGNNFRSALAAIAESDFQRQKRRNKVLDHLLGRFGETFSEFVASLISTDSDPEDNPGWFSFDDYLKDKATYLMELPGLGYHQSRGYNYRKLIASKLQTDVDASGLPATFEGITNLMNNHPDVWNTKNVSGVKKRVCFHLGLTELKDGYDEDGRRHYLWESSTLFGEPPYTLDLVSYTERGRTQHYIALRRKKPTGFERLDRSDTLLESTRFMSRKKALALRKELYQILDETTWYQPAPGKIDTSLQCISFKQGGKELLYSEDLKPEWAELRRREIVSLVEPRESLDYDGFHLIEHILLRPNELGDELLEIPLNGINPPDPYSSIVTIVAPDWTRRFKHESFRLQFEKTMGVELPGYVYPRFCYIDRDTMQKFEIAYKDWMIALATCRPDECRVNETVKALIRLLEEEIHSVNGCSKNVAPESPCT